MFTAVGVLLMVAYFLLPEAARGQEFAAGNLAFWGSLAAAYICTLKMRLVQSQSQQNGSD